MLPRIKIIFADRKARILAVRIAGTVVLAVSCIAQIVGFVVSDTKGYSAFLSIIYEILLAMRIMTIVVTSRYDNNFKVQSRVYIASGILFMFLSMYIMCFYIYIALNPISNIRPLWITALQLTYVFICVVSRVIALRKKSTPSEALYKMICNVASGLMFIIAVNGIFELAAPGLKIYILEEGALLTILVWVFMVLCFVRGRNLRRECNRAA